MFDVNKKAKKASELNFFDFDAIKLGIASPEQILSWSYGEVKKPETINYRTLKPERDGLFCERIFGPTKDYECACGKYRWVKFKGMCCDRCGVEITESKVRRERMGHIELAVPVTHIWFFQKNRFSVLLDMRKIDLEKVIYYASYVVLEDAVDPATGRTDYKKGDILSEEQVREARKKYGPKLKADIGAPAVQALLASLDFNKEIPALELQLKETQSEAERTKLLRRIKMMKEFRDSGNRPEWMVLSVLPVIPPDLRPLVPLDGGRFAASDLNDLYRRIITRNNRLKHIKSLQAPMVMVYNEMRLLQEAVDALIDNGSRGKVFLGSGGRPLKSLSDAIKGKHGRFRQNLLGKRVDYSGRSVIVVGPNLKLNQCGLPKLMALELFKPFIIGELMKKEGVTLKAAKKKLERVSPEIWDILEKVTKNHPVLLNRAPTLHRLGIQAFEPVLIEGKAIQLHPLTCAAFNADFDGDQMAVHVPLTIEAQIEARTLMLATNNILSPASGRPIASPSHDMVLGINYITKIKDKDLGEGMIFADKEDALIALEYGKIALHAKIKVGGITKKMNEGKDVSKWTDYTSVGRIIFNQILPKGWDYLNKDVDKKALAKMVRECYNDPSCGHYETVQFLDRIMSLGYKYATKSGISISIADMIVPASKNKKVKDAQQKVREIQELAEDGMITEGERYNKVIDIWTKVTDDIAEELFKEMADVEKKPVKKGEQKFNSVYIMANSGARGSRQQVRQFAGMRGLMAKPQKKLTGGAGEIIENPITSNFREGLTVLEYFISTHGSRKGMSDTALKTADAGYLTRRLIDVGHNLVVTEDDCGTTDGVVLRDLKSGEEVIEPLSERIVGRTSLEEIKDKQGKAFIKVGDLITAEQGNKVKENEVESVRVRSVLTCDSRHGVCAKCYGNSLATGASARIGDTVGIIAAQSIGEPGTQLTLRTFHIGGAASRELEEPGASFKVHDAKVIYGNMGEPLLVEENGESKKVCISKNAKVLADYSYDKAYLKEVSKNFTIPVGTTFVLNSSEIEEIKTKNGEVYVLDAEATIPVKDDKGNDVKLTKKNLERIKVRFKDFKVDNCKIFKSKNGYISVKDQNDKVSKQKIANDAQFAILEKDKEFKTDEDKNTICLLKTNSISVKESDGKITEYKFPNNAEISFNLKEFDVNDGKIYTVKEKNGIIELEKTEIHNIKEGAKLIKEEGSLAKVGERIAEWDPHNKVIIAKQDGSVELVDVVEGETLLRKINTVTGVVDNEITVNKNNREKRNPKIIIKGKKGKEEYLLPAGSILLAEDEQKVNAGAILVKIPEETGGTKDITGGLPRIAELFEARKPKNPAIIAEFDGVIRLETSPKGLTEVVLSNEEIQQEKHYPIPQGKHLRVYTGDKVAKGDALTDGAIDPHDVLRVKDIKEVQEFLLNAIQEVYRLQGVTINDKHIEVIVRQMLSNVKIQEAGDSTFLKDQIVSRSEYLKENDRLEKEGKNKAFGKPILLGISKASLSSESFISAASFQETTRVLTDAAIKGQVDDLEGLKENVIVGHLIPAGTGIATKNIRREFEEKAK